MACTSLQQVAALTRMPLLVAQDPLALRIRSRRPHFSESRSHADVSCAADQMPIDASKLAKDAGAANARPVIAFTIYKFTRGKGKAPTSLDAREYRKFPLIAKTDVNHNTIAFRFALPSSSHRLGLPVGRHVVVRKPAESKEGDPIARSYTPVTSDDQLGWFDLVIKIYEQGKMGQYLKHLPLNTEVEMRGPQGHLSYLGGGRFDIQRRNTATNTSAVKSYQIRNVGLIAGGTGLTPMLQIMREVVKNSATDRTNLSFIFANVTETDIILRKELDEMAEKHSNLKVYYTLDKPPADWKFGAGFVNQAMIKDRMPPPGDDTLILVCGPPPMCKAQEANLKALNYSDDSVFVY